MLVPRFQGGLTNTNKGAMIARWGGGRGDGRQEPPLTDSVFPFNRSFCFASGGVACPPSREGWRGKGGEGKEKKWNETGRQLYCCGGNWVG